MIKLTKLLLVLLFLLFTGCEDKPVTVIVDNIDYMKKMDPRLKTYPEAVEWYEDAESYPEAAFSLGIIYQTKIKDYKKALEWYKNSYERGYKKAANNIGTAYENLKDYEKAIDWYIIASNQKHENAPSNIGYIYEIKFKNYKKAIKWYKVGIERESTINKKHCMVIL